MFVGPIHFGNVDQTFNTIFELGKATVVSEVGNDRFDTGTFRIATGNIGPGIFTHLFHAQ